MTATKPIFITMGDPGGVGAEITLKAWQQREAKTLPPFFLHHDLSYLRQLAGKFGWQIPFAAITAPEEAAGHFTHALPVLPIGQDIPLRLGSGDSSLAPLITASIKTGVDFCQSGRVAGMVTNPINKAVMYAGGFAYPGQTEFLGALCGQKSLMILANHHIRVAPFTGHIPLAAVREKITADNLLAYIRHLHNLLTRQLPLPNPRIAVCGLNPHAGDGGGLGTEEIEIIEPALHQLRQMGFHIIGPLPADTAFHTDARKNYDVIVGMYHDQVLIPVKTIDFWNSANITLGLGIIRTSPDHGTAFDIAARGIARPDSMIASIRYAAELKA